MAINTVARWLTTLLLTSDSVQCLYLNEEIALYVGYTGRILDRVLIVKVRNVDSREDLVLIDCPVQVAHAGAISHLKYRLVHDLLPLVTDVWKEGWSEWNATNFARIIRLFCECQHFLMKRGKFEDSAPIAIWEKCCTIFGIEIENPLPLTDYEQWMFANILLANDKYKVKPHIQRQGRDTSERIIRITPKNYYTDFERYSVNAVKIEFYKVA
jgi:hypothetical protein